MVITMNNFRTENLNNLYSIGCNLLYSIVFLALIFSNVASAIDLDTYISKNKVTNGFTLATSRKPAPLVVSSKDFAGVIRISKHLQKDIENVTGTAPKLFTDSIPKSNEIVIIGTIGKSPIIDQLIKNKILNVDNIIGKWEVSLIQTIENPFPNVERALVIAGSDKRGTIYGIYDLSEKIGVSPWYFWADVPVQKKENIYIKPGRYTYGEPKVKYRGIFINDEAPALTGWSRVRFGGFNSKFYEHVFELILRLKGNYLWPAMWGSAFYDDDPENPRLADEYGVVIGTSHHEPMMRAHDEWRRYGKGAWNYEKNDSTLRDFWSQSIKRMGTYESVVTLAMRGDGDEAMSPTANVALLERIVADQRKILADVTGKDLTKIPQVWAIYKEVQEYYDKGMRVPDDVTILLCDDNWGNVRKLPKASDLQRSGGFGMYYHYDFVGGPRNYKWLNTSQIERVWEQMHLSYRYGIDRIWIVNVGDIKPMEFPISFFLDFAWDPEKIQASDLPEYSRRWAERQFGAKYSKEIAEVLNKYTKFNSRRKPEMLDPNTYSLVNYREAETVVSEYNSLVEKAERVGKKLPKEYSDGFYQLILHQPSACATVNELYVTVGKNRLYANQGRAATNNFARQARELFKKDSLITHYYNNVMANGKWAHMMDQTHIGYTYWQQPDKNYMPEVKEIQIPNIADMGVAIEGSEKWFPNEKSEAILPEFDVYNQQTYYIEVFNRGKIPFQYLIEPQKSWIKTNKNKGKIETEERIWVSIDWKKTPKGKHRIPITITGPNKAQVVVYAIVKNPENPKLNQIKGFVESNGYVSIEAENYSNAIGNSTINWITIPNLGRTASSVTAMPVVVEPQTLTEDSPRLEYQVHLFTAGELNVHFYISPIQNFGYGEGIRFASSFNDEKPQIINIQEGEVIPDWKYPQWWNQMVSDNVKKITLKHKIQKPGEQVLKFWLIDPGVVLQKIIIVTGELKPSYLGPPQSFNRAIK